MAKRIEKFTAPYRNSGIPFLLAEVLTDGKGDMVDLIFRFVNSSACALLDAHPETLVGKRFTHIFPASQLERLAPVQTVAFSGSSAAFSYTSVLGQTCQIICYQPMYGMVGCILDCGCPPESKNPDTLLTDQLPGAVVVLEMSRAGLRCLSFSPHLCDLTGREYRELLDFYADDLSTLVLPEDWPELLQVLLDSARSGQAVDHTFRLIRKDETALWANLRAELMDRQQGVTTFCALLLDVNGQERSRERQAASLHQAKAALAQYSSLFNSLPGGYCILCQQGERLAPLCVSQGLSTLLGCSEVELRQNLELDPLWYVAPADRQELVDVARLARAQGLPLRHTCRLRCQDEHLCWGLVEAVWQARNDGTTLLLLSCTNLTAERTLLSELEFRAKLCDLLLDDSQIISFDYDPDQDICRIYRRDKGGRRTTRVIPEYLCDLQRSTVIHPEDKRHLAAAFKRASNHPTTDVVEYRANYDDQGWRWYRVSWVSLFDENGNVYRLVGRAENITRRRAAAQRFLDLKKQLKKPDCSVLAAIQLDLADNRIMDATCSSSDLTQTLLGNTAEDCIRHIGGQIPTSEQRNAFEAAFSRNILLNSFHHGHQHMHLEHRFSPVDATTIWVETAIELIEDPETAHITAFCTLRDVDWLHRQSLLLNTLAALDYDLVLAVNAASGRCRKYGHLPAEDVAYGDICAQYREVYGAEVPALERICRQLQEEPIWSYSLSNGHKGVFRWCWLDQTDAVLLLTIQDSGVSFAPFPTE